MRLADCNTGRLFSMWSRRQKVNSGLKHTVNRTGISTNPSMKQLKYLLLALLGVVGLLLIWGLIEPYVIDTEEEVASIPNLPPA